MRIDIGVDLGRDHYRVTRREGGFESVALGEPTNTSLALRILADAYHELRASLLARNAPTRERVLRHEQEKANREELVRRAKDMNQDKQ